MVGSLFRKIMGNTSRNPQTLVRKKQHNGFGLPQSIRIQKNTDVPIVCCRPISDVRLKDPKWLKFQGIIPPSERSEHGKYWEYFNRKNIGK
jgi:hypothetical protein